MYKQKAYEIIKKESGKRRYKIVNSIDEIKNKCIMIKLDEVDGSIVLYYHDKNWDNVDDIITEIDFVMDWMNAVISIEMF